MGVSVLVGARAGARVAELVRLAVVVERRRPGIGTPLGSRAAQPTRHVGGSREPPAGFGPTARTENRLVALRELPHRLEGRRTARARVLVQRHSCPPERGSTIGVFGVPYNR